MTIKLIKHLLFIVFTSQLCSAYGQSTIQLADTNAKFVSELTVIQAANSKFRFTRIQPHSYLLQITDSSSVFDLYFTYLYNNHRFEFVIPSNYFVGQQTYFLKLVHAKAPIFKKVYNVLLTNSQTALTTPIYCKRFRVKGAKNVGYEKG